MSEPARFQGWPWRDFGHFAMSEYEAVRAAAHAELMALRVGLEGVGRPRPVSDWTPWAKCDAAAFAEAGIGQPACAPN